ncbi:MAG: right-handed parallel beta-helix repeat-containing protein, partial [SAR324 cluster bacterium]|nr:right-handed parallel beta-helix repeat-containing protein [SAR324 cluster bacterium]
LTLSGGDRGLHMHYQGTMGQIDNCIIENNKKDGIAVWTAAAIDIENSIVRNNGLDGWGNGLSIWDSYGGISNSKIENHDNGNGIGILGNSTGWIQKNQITVAKYSGISIGENSVGYIGGDPDSDGTENGNTLTGPFETGIQVGGNSYAEIIGNVISGYSREGIIIYGNSSSKIGSDNDQDTYDSSKRSKYGNTLDGMALTGQSVKDWQRGIQVSESSTAQLKRNLIENNSGGGIRVSENAVLELGGGNIIQNNMHTESDGDIEGSGFDLRSGSALEMWNSAQEREPNTITGNGEYAFRVEGSHLDLRGGDDGSTQNNRLVISGHQIGIRASKGSKVTLERVDVQNNTRGGIRISENSILSVYDGGATITGNGLIGGACHDESDYGLKISDNSLAALDYITVSNNCYGINVETNSSLDGGWAGNSSEIDYGMIIQGNLKNGIEVQTNSVLEVEYLLLGGSGTNEGNSSEYDDDALDVSRNSYASLRNSRIEGNFGRAIEVKYNSNMDLDDTVITGNGIGLDQSDSAISIGNLSTANINRSDVSSGTGGGISIWNGSIVRIYETNITVDASLVTDTYSTALNVSNSALELSNYSDSAFTLSSSDGSEISMNQSSKLSLSGYTFDTTSSNDDINVYQTEISLSQIPEGQDIKIYLGDDSRLYFNHSFSAEIISQLNCSSGRTVDDVRINLPGIAYLNGNDPASIGSASSECVVAE